MRCAAAAFASITAAAEQARDYCLQKRDAALAELSEKLGARVGMEEIGRNKWLAQTFDAHGHHLPAHGKRQSVIHGRQNRLDAQASSTGCRG